MAWRDDLQKGSFRGVPFFWQKADGEGGRKTARHDYPQRDETYVEDMGKAPREFTLEVYVLGANYMAERDRLIIALEQPGPGTLVHPTFGTLSVSQTSKPRWSETTSEGGICRFTLMFVCAGANQQPSASVDTAAVVATRADVARSAVAAAYVKQVKVAGFPAFVAASLTDLADKGLAAIGTALKTVAPPLLPGVAGGMLTKLVDLRSAVVDLTRVPSAMAGELQGLIITANLLTSNPFVALTSLRSLFDFNSGLAVSSAITPARRQQATNQSAFIALVRHSAIIEATLLSTQVDYLSYQEALASRDELAELLDSAMDTADDDSYSALVALRIALVQDIATRGGNLARISSYTPACTLPALVIAHRLYGDASRDTEIISRNRIPHPGFITGGSPLEVLLNG